MKSIDTRETSKTRLRYQRIAPIYDLMETLPERRFQSWRERLWSLVEGPEVLELGVGTGKNILYYPDDVQVTAIDLTPEMIERAKQRATVLDHPVELRIGDAQALDFPDDTFDTVVATFVFCSVPGPVVGLREAHRVLKPGGRMLLLEHVRSNKPLIGTLMDVVDPIIVRMMGPHINRETVGNVEKAGFTLEKVENIGGGDIFKLIIARKSDELSQPGKMDIEFT